MIKEKDPDTLYVVISDKRGIQKTQCRRKQEFLGCEKTKRAKPYLAHFFKKKTLSSKSFSIGPLLLQILTSLPTFHKIIQNNDISLLLGEPPFSYRENFPLKPHYWPILLGNNFVSSRDFWHSEGVFSDVSYVDVLCMYVLCM